MFRSSAVIRVQAYARFQRFRALEDGPPAKEDDLDSYLRLSAQFTQLITVATKQGLRHA
jgi:hypothetical protein